MFSRGPADSFRLFSRADEIRRCFESHFSYGLGRDHRLGLHTVVQKREERKVRESQSNGVSEIRVQWTFIELKTDPREICFSFSVVTSKSFRLEIVFHLTVAAVDRSPSIGCFMAQ